MGEIRAEVTVENTVDRGLVRRGQGSEGNIRRTTLSGVVDSGAVSLLLPTEVVEHLGLEVVGTTRVTYADEREDELGVAGPVTVRIGDRSVMTECIVGRTGTQVLIGQVVLEQLDLIADCRNRTPTPRDPDGPVIAVR